MFRRRKQVDRWLAPLARLPSPAVLEAEPRLRWLEENAVYRRLRMPGRQVPSPQSIRSFRIAGGASWIALAWFQLLLAPSVPSRAIGFLVLAGFAAASQFPWPRILGTRSVSPRFTGTSAPLPGFTELEVADLLLAGISAGTIARGMWGQGVGGVGRWSALFISFALVAAACGWSGLLARYPPYDPSDPLAVLAFHVYPSILATWGVFRLASGRVDRGWRALSGLAAGLRLARDGEKPWKEFPWLKSMAKGLGRVLVVGFALAATLAVVALGVVLEDLARILFHPASLLTLGSAIGVFTGARLAKSARTNRDRNFDEAVECVRELLEASRVKLFEAGGAR